MSFVWGIRVRVGVRVGVRVSVRVEVRVRVRVGVRVGVRVRVRVISLRDSFSVLLRPQHLSMLTTHGRKYTSKLQSTIIYSNVNDTLGCKLHVTHLRIQSAYG